MKLNPKPTLIIGPTGSGKSHLLTYLLQRQGGWVDNSDQVVVFSNPAASHAYLFLHETPALKRRNRIYTELDETIIDGLIKRNEALYPDNLIRTLVIFDDALLKKDRNEQCLAKLFQWTRKLHIVPIVCQQQYTQCSTTWRSNITHIFVFSLRDINSKEQVYQNYLSSKYNKKQALEVLNSLEPYECLFVTYQTAGQASIFRFKAKKLEE